MDSKKIKTLEKKTQAIVDILSDLEGETERQQAMGDSLEESRDAILALASDLRDVAEQLSGVIDMVNNSTLGEDVSRLAAIESSCEGLREQIGHSASREADIASRLEALESVIGRIDRNTQKGFFKEHE